MSLFLMHKYEQYLTILIILLRFTVLLINLLFYSQYDKDVISTIEISNLCFYGKYYHACNDVVLGSWSERRDACMWTDEWEQNILFNRILAFLIVFNWLFVILIVVHAIKRSRIFFSAWIKVLWTLLLWSRLIVLLVNVKGWMELVFISIFDSIKINNPLLTQKTYLQILHIKGHNDAACRNSCNSMNLWKTIKIKPNWKNFHNVLFDVRICASQRVSKIMF